MINIGIELEVLTKGGIFEESFKVTYAENKLHFLTDEPALKLA